MAWCAVGLDQQAESHDPDETVEFEIRVRLASGESHARCVAKGRRWRLLRVKIAEAGPPITHHAVRGQGALLSGVGNLG